MSGLFASVKRVADEKRKFRQQQARAKALPEDYAYVYRQIQHYLWWGYWGADDVDWMPIFADLLDLFETGAAEGKRVLEVTGEDVAAFCDELLRNAKTWTGDRSETLNRDIQNKLGKGKGA